MNQRDLAQWSYDYRPHQEAHRGYVDKFDNYEECVQPLYQEVGETQFYVSYIQSQHYQEFHHHHVLRRSHMTQHHEDDYERQREMLELAQITNEKFQAQDVKIDELWSEFRDGFDEIKQQVKRIIELKKKRYAEDMQERIDRE